jgi:hypothetical protein
MTARVVFDAVYQTFKTLRERKNQEAGSSKNHKERLFPKTPGQLTASNKIAKQWSFFFEHGPSSSKRRPSRIVGVTVTYTLP